MYKMGVGLMTGARKILIEMDIPPLPELPSDLLKTSDIRKAELLVQLMTCIIAANYRTDDGVEP